MFIGETKVETIVKSCTVRIGKVEYVWHCYCILVHSNFVFALTMTHLPVLHWPRRFSYSM